MNDTTREIAGLRQKLAAQDFELEEAKSLLRRVRYSHAIAKHLTPNFKRQIDELCSSGT